MKDSSTEKTVLIVEDDEDIRDSITEVLEDLGYHAVGAHNGRDALDKLQSPQGIRPSLILLDMMMPVMDGWQFRAAQLEDSELREIPVVALTAYADTRRIISEIGTTVCLKKPVELRELVAVVERFCGPAKKV